MTAEDKKRVLVESGAEAGGTLTMQKVTSAVRLLGSAFFQEYTSGRKDRGLKTYDQSAFNVAEEVPEDEDDGTNWSFFEEHYDEELIEQLATEDPDAALVMQFEQSVTDTVQDDPDLAAFFSNYQEARKRLQEKVRSRGFWTSSKGSASSKGGGKRFGVKGKMGKGFKSLQQRIAETYCRHCQQKGHWRAECPLRKSQNDQAGENLSRPSLHRPQQRSCSILTTFPP